MLHLIKKSFPTPVQLAQSSKNHFMFKQSTWPMTTAILALLVFGILPTTTLAKPKLATPNILFIIMDDVGIDQMELFGYGGIDPITEGRAPDLPTIGAIADEGIAFRNAWSMPACSTSRAVFFTGRFPLRTHVLGALGPDDLANAQVSPFEISLPTLLKPSGYESALFGKFHLGLQGHNPFTYAMPSSLGWDYFYGWLDVTGDPSSIDTTAGLGDPTVAPGNYSCGFVPRFDPEGMHGADFGACYNAKGQCQDLVISEGMPPGRTCRDGGGILQPNHSCQHKMPENIEAGFQNLSAHYVSPLVINTKNGKVEKVPSTDIRSRTYRGSSPVDGAIDWIKRQPSSKPWMASISFASAHTPAMQPPQALLSSDPAVTSNLSCATTGDNQMELDLAQRELTTLMIEAMDTEIARLLVSIGVASYNEDGTLNYTTEDNDNTMIVMLGDNGTLGNIVKLPFDPTRAKGTAYQTGVWVPLVIAGPLVDDPKRQVTQMVNIVDLYQLFGEIAGIEDVHAAVPRKLDAQTMMPYLKDAEADSVRSLNFTQVGTNEQANGAINGPCQIATGCTQIPVTQGVCEDNAGTWWGKGSDIEGLPEEGLQFCCNVNQYLYQKATDMSLPYYDPTPPTYLNLQPLTSAAIRNDHFKVVRNTFMGDPTPPAFPEGGEPTCDAPDFPDEFYEINEDEINPRIDLKAENLVVLFDPLPAPLQLIYDQLRSDLDEVLHSEIPCPSNDEIYMWTFDGNLDGVINEQDLSDLELFAELAVGKSSWYDVNLDGKTNDDDHDLVESKLGLNCAPE